MAALEDVTVSIPENSICGPGTAGWVQGSRSNAAIAWALVGFMIPFGVTSVAAAVPFALALGATRRSFVTGTLHRRPGLHEHLAAAPTGHRPVTSPVADARPRGVA